MNSVRTPVTAAPPSAAARPKALGPGEAFRRPAQLNRARVIAAALALLLLVRRSSCSRCPAAQGRLGRLTARRLCARGGADGLLRARAGRALQREE